MNQKTANFSNKICRSKILPQRKPTLFSSEDSDQMAAESLRARLVQQLTAPEQPTPRDFAAYFYSSTKTTDPAISVTSHHIQGPLPRRRPAIPAYPCMQSLRWNPCVETSSYDDDLDMPERPDRYHDLDMPERHDRCHDLKVQKQYKSQPTQEEYKHSCRCENCTMKNCKFREPLSDSDRLSSFRDNIMTFCDQDTMTPKLNETGCGGTPLHSSHTSNVSVNISNIAVKDTQASMEIHQLYEPEKCPTSILKRNRQFRQEFLSYSHPQYEHQKSNNYRYQHQRDLEEEYFKPAIKSSRKSFFKFKKKVTNPDCSRRIIYNEGISDRAVTSFPMSPPRVPSPTTLKVERSKSSVRSAYLEDGIPHAHRSNSKYHHNCKKSNSKSFYGDSEEVRHLVRSPSIIGKRFTNKPVTSCKLKVKMPKPVLSSERDIDSFIDQSFWPMRTPIRREVSGFHFRDDNLTRSRDKDR